MTSTVRGMGELLAYLPYQLGFRPTDSLVAVGLRDGHAEVTARIDLAPRGEEHAEVHGVERVAQVFVRAKVDGVVCAAYPGARGPAATTAVLIRARAVLAEQGLPAGHLLVADEHTWWAAVCACGGCPEEQSPIPGADRVPAVFDSVLRGVAPLGRRSDLSRMLACRDLPRARAVDRAMQWAGALDDRSFVDLVSALLTGGRIASDVPAYELASLSRTLAVARARDAAFGVLTPGIPATKDTPPTALETALRDRLRSIDDSTTNSFGAERGAVRARLIEWVQVLPDAARPPVLTLLAGAAWSSGNGALAAVAVEQALDLDHDYRLAALLDHALTMGVRPQSSA